MRSAGEEEDDQGDRRLPLLIARTSRVAMSPRSLPLETNGGRPEGDAQ